MQLAEGTRANVAHVADGQRPDAEPSLSSALEHLVASSQGVIAKRIDLALLEGQERLSRTLRVAALVGLGIVLAAGTWFAVATCLVLVVTPGAGLIARLAIFALLNGAGALGLVALAVRGRPSTPPSSSGSVAAPSATGT